MQELLKLCDLYLLKKLYLVHYGSKIYDPNRVLPIKNHRQEKPIGGLWTSPLFSEYGWKDWCNESEFRSCKEISSFRLKLLDNSKVIVLENEKDLLSLPRTTSNNIPLVDFELLAKNYDAIWLTVPALRSQDTLTNYSDLNNISFSSWDCESVLILNKNCFKIID